MRNPAPGIGAVWISAMLFVRSWSFGLHVDVWDRGVDVMLGLGPWRPRFIWTKGN